MEGARQAELLAACRVLFGCPMEPEFLFHLRDSGVRVAYRRRVLDTHPDRVTDLEQKRLHTERFIETHRAYALLREFVLHRDRTPPRPHPPASRSARSAAGAARPPGGGRPRPEPRPRPAGPVRCVPRRRLRFGEFLYYNRAISFATLIEALLWQRRQRARFGEISRRWGYLSEAQMAALLASRRPLEPVGEAARRMRLLTDFQVRTVICFQGMCQRKIGAFFVEHGHLPPARVDELLRLFEDHNTAFPPRRR
jgi:hypothetical protein